MGCSFICFPMARKPVNWLTVRKFYCGQIGVSRAEATNLTATHFKITPRAVRQHTTDEGWEEIRELKGGQTVVSIERGIEHKEQREIREAHTPRQLTGNRENDRLVIVRNAIDGIGFALAGINYEDLKSAAGGANALVKLMELELKLAPMSASQLADAAITAGISPDRFTAELAAQWQKRA